MVATASVWYQRGVGYKVRCGHVFLGEWNGGPENGHVAHLLLFTLVTGLPASTSALARDRRGLLHLA